jgi:hypothetical protein
MAADIADSWFQAGLNAWVDVERRQFSSQRYNANCRSI